MVTLAAALVGCAAPSAHERTVARADALMQAAPGRSGDLTLRCDPEDAVVEVDGVPQGVCADFDGRTRRLDVGDRLRRVVVKKDGFWPYQTYYQSGGARAALVISLRPKSSATEQGAVP